MDANSITVQEAPEPQPSPAGLAKRVYFWEGIIFAAICFTAGMLNFVAQAIFKHYLKNGEFGLTQTIFAEAVFFTIPLSAVNHCFSHFFARYEADGQQDKVIKLQKAAQTLIEWLAIIIGVLACGGLALMILLFKAPRPGLEFLLFLFTLESLAIAVSGSFCLGLSRFRFWGALLFASAIVRVLLAAFCLSGEPWAEAALLVTMGAGLIQLLPILLDDDREKAETEESKRGRHLEAWKTFTNPEFMGFFGACLSGNVAMFLFAYADFIIAQHWFGMVSQDGWTPVFPTEFDSYFAAGVLGRALLFAAAPLLVVFFTQRSQLHKTTLASLKLFWLHAACILCGAGALILVRPYLILLFSGTQEVLTYQYLYYFAVAMVPVGWLHGITTFCIASRRYPECYMLGGFSILYCLVLFFFGHHPENMIVYIFAGSSLALLATLFFGIVRWSRGQP